MARSCFLSVAASMNICVPNVESTVVESKGYSVLINKQSFNPKTTFTVTNINKPFNFPNVRFACVANCVKYAFVLGSGCCSEASVVGKLHAVTDSSALL